MSTGTPAREDIGSPSRPADVPTRTVAVVDIGSTSIRLAIGEIDAAGHVRTLETLTQAVSLGKDTFTQGSISKSTIEDCVRVLTSYKQNLREYQITQPEQIRVVATSAVREASNRLAFIDRIYIATGLQVEALDEAEVNRVTYLGVQPYLEAEASLAGAYVIVTEVGGGSTELLLVRDGDVLAAETYRLGSVRFRQTLEAYRAPTGHIRKVMEAQLRRAVEQLREQIPADGRVELLALGGDVRFAAGRLINKWKPDSLSRIPLEELEQFCENLLALSVDQIVQQYHVSFQEAETLGTALLTYVAMARAFELSEVMLTNTNLRDGLLHEMAEIDTWSDEFRNQIIRSAVSLGRHFDFDEAHARHVAELSHALFLQLAEEHGLPSRFETVLYVAALLHEIGGFVSRRSLHKHSMYLIRNSELFGLSRQNLLLIALVARYHRRASPQPNHEGYSNLDRDDRIAVAKLAAILRLAIALDESRSQRIRSIECSVEQHTLVVHVANVEDISLEQLALRQSGSLFEEVYGKQLLLRIVRRP